MKHTMQNPPKQVPAQRIKKRNLILITLAGLINAFGVTIFLAPVKLYDSGISGTAMLLS